MADGLVPGNFGGRTLLPVAAAEVKVDIPDNVREIALLNEGANRVHIALDLGSTVITVDDNLYGSIPALGSFTYNVGKHQTLHLISVVGATTVTIIFS